MAASTDLIILATSILISFGLIVRFWRLRTQAGSWGLFAAICAATFWSVFYMLEFTLPQLSLKILSAKFEYIGIALVPLGIFLFGLQYSGHAKWINGRSMALLSIIPFLTILIAFTNEAHHLLWTQISVYDGVALSPLVVTHGWYFLVHTIYSYILLLLTTFLIFQLVGNSHGVYRAQALVVLVGMIFPWAVNFLYLTNFSTFSHFDLTPIAFTITNICFAIGLIRFNLLELVPMANEAIINSMQDSVIVIDQEERVIEINHAAERTFHLQGEVIGKLIQKILPRYSEWVQDVPFEKQLEKEISMGDAEKIAWYRLQITPVINRRNQITGRVVLLNDVTVQKRFLSQIMLQATAMDAASNGIVITDPDGTIEWVNQAFTKLTGYSKEEAIGQNPRILKSGRMPAEVYTTLWNTIAAGKIWHGDVINRKKDGTVYYEEMSITPQTEQDGQIAHFIAIKQDVSQRRQAEETLKAAHKQALEASEMKTRLLANVSHDLRTPLGIILGYVEMLQSGYYGQLPDPQKNVLGEIIYSSNQLLSFINNLVGQAQLETGRVMIRNQKFNPCEMMDTVYGVTNLLAKKKGIAFSTSIEPGLSQVIIGDPYWLQQILQNLVNNALKFTQAGKVEARLFRPDPEHWSLQVADTGEGIPDGARAMIFEPFRQMNGSITGRLGGSGLGLNIVRELTKLMGGAIDLQSELGKGSTFTVTFPWISDLPQKKEN